MTASHALCAQATRVRLNCRDESARPLIFAYIMSTNDANATQQADGPQLDAAQPAEPPVRRSNRISNKIVKSTKGTCGEAAARVSLSSPDASPGDDECSSPSQPSVPIMASQSRSATANGIIYVTETVLQQYVRVTIRGHTIEDNSVFLFFLVTKSSTLIQAYQWCSNCRNGGYLIVCSGCNERAFCSACLQFSTEGDDDFLCPICYYKNPADGPGNKRTKYDPYVSCYNFLDKYTT